MFKNFLNINKLMKYQHDKLPNCWISIFSKSSLSLIICRVFDTENFSLSFSHFHFFSHFLSIIMSHSEVSNEHERISFRRNSYKIQGKSNTNTKFYSHRIFAVAHQLKFTSILFFTPSSFSSVRTQISLCLVV